MTDHCFEPYLVKRSKRVHWCYGCNKEMPKGSSYVRQSGVQDGELFSNSWCAACDKKADKFTLDDWEYFSPGDFAEVTQAEGG